MKKEFIVLMSVIIAIFGLPIFAEADNVEDELAIISYSEIYDNYPVLKGMFARGTSDVPENITAGQNIFQIQTFGWSADENDFSGPTAEIMFEAAEDFDGTGGWGTNIRFWTTNVGETEIDERMRIEPNGYVGIGTRGPATELEVSSQAEKPVRLDVTTYNNSNLGSVITGRRARSSNGVPSAVQEGDKLFSLAGQGHGEDEWGARAAASSIVFVATENFTNTAKGTAILFGTIPNGTTVRNESMLIDHNGNVGIGTTTPQSTLQVNGYVQLALTDGGPPPAEDCDDPSEYGRMKVDATNELLYICVASGWMPIDRNAGRDTGKDFNGDGTPDVLVRNRVSGEWYLYLMHSNGVSILKGVSMPFTKNLDWEFADIVDFDHDGTPDVMVRNKVSGEWYLYLMHEYGYLVKKGVSMPFTHNQDWQLLTD